MCHLIPGMLLFIAAILLSLGCSTEEARLMHRIDNTVRGAEALLAENPSPAEKECLKRELKCLKSLKPNDYRSNNLVAARFRDDEMQNYSELVLSLIAGVPNIRKVNIYSEGNLVLTYDIDGGVRESLKEESDRHVGYNVLVRRWGKWMASDRRTAPAILLSGKSLRARVVDDGARMSDPCEILVELFRRDAPIPEGVDPGLYPGYNKPDYRPVGRTTTDTMRIHPNMK